MAATTGMERVLVSFSESQQNLDSTLINLLSPHRYISDLLFTNILLHYPRCLLLHARQNWPEPLLIRPLWSPPAMSTDLPRTVFQSQESTPPITILLTVILLIFLFVGFFSIYFCRCVMESLLHSRNLRRTPSGNLVGASASPANTGLDPLLIKAFPTFPYSGIKDFRKDKYGLECAICLVEFEDDSFLRLLTVCCHVFHQECIDLWLESHKTCPVCRGNLESPRNSADKSPDHDQNSSMQYMHESDHESIEDAISIDIEDDDDDMGPEEEPNPSTGSSRRTKRCSKKLPDDDDGKKFTRSHSTGHSIVKCKGEEEEDRYTLRLPEHIKIKIIRGHNWTGSCVTFEEFSRHPSSNSGGFLEVSGSDQTKLDKP